MSSHHPPPAAERGTSRPTRPAVVPRKPVSIDEEDIDFSSIAPPSSSTATVSGGGPNDASSSSFAVAGGGTLPAVAAALLVDTPGSPTFGSDERGGDDAHKASELRAYDPALQAYTMRNANAVAVNGRRRKTVFGGPAPSVAASSTASTNETAANTSAVAPTPSSHHPPSSAADSGGSASTAEKEEELAVLLGASSVSNPAVQHERRRVYEAALRDFCQRGREPPSSPSPPPPPPSPLPGSSSSPQTFPCGPTQSNSLLQQLFVDGVPDVEPWDRWALALPRYDPNAITVRPDQPRTLTGVVDLVHHPVLPDSHYTRHYQHRATAQPTEVKLMKTKEELRAERRERLKQKQEQQRRERAAAKANPLAQVVTGEGMSAVGGASSSSSDHDQLRVKNLAFNLFNSSVLNPLGVENKVLAQYEQRFLDHQRRNHERHVSALPNQIAKRERDVVRHASEQPILRAYRIYPIFTPAHLGKLRHFANDNRLRGCVLWVAQCDAVVLLAGGEVAMRHLDRWILHKMKWESTHTRATALCSVPLCDAESFSFHAKKHTAGEKRGRTGKDGKDGDASEREAVYMNFVETVEEGEQFLRQLPATGSPWKDFAGVWRAAFLADGLSSP